MNAIFWDRIADKYAANPIGDMPAYEATLDRVRSYLAPDHRLLEVGCGTGSTALLLSPRVAETVATDISARMIEIAKGKEGAAHVDFRVAGALDPQPDTPFDVVCAFNLLHLMDDIDLTVAGLARHVAPGGLLITKTPCLSEMFIGLRLILPLMRMVGKAPAVCYFDRRRLQKAFERAGLDIVEHRHFGTAEKTRFIVARKPG